MSNRETGLINVNTYTTAPLTLAAGTLAGQVFSGYTPMLSQITSIVRTVSSFTPGAGAGLGLLSLVQTATAGGAGVPYTTTFTLNSTNVADTSTFVISYITKVA